MQDYIGESLDRRLKMFYEGCDNGSLVVVSKKEGKDQESIQSSTNLTQDINGKVTTSQLDFTRG